MNRNYQFYYFVPLITFWYTVIHLTMAIPPKVHGRNSERGINNLYMCFKFVALLSIITVLYTSEVFFKKIFFFSFWKFLFVDSDDSINEWWFRWRIDRYTVPAGMIFAFLYQTFKHYGLIDDNHRADLFSKNYLYLTSFLSFLGISVSSSFFSCSCFSSFQSSLRVSESARTLWESFSFSCFYFQIYISFTFLCPSKSDCNEIHPYGVVVPIISYIFLRNLSAIRTKYSSFFSWFGKISLEVSNEAFKIFIMKLVYDLLTHSSYRSLLHLLSSFSFASTTSGWRRTRRAR